MKDDREFWLQIRRGLLMVVGAIEERWGFPRTAAAPRVIQTLGQQPPASPVEPAAHSVEPPH